MNPIELGKFIASLRNEKNLTQEELAEMLYIDKRKISRWECGNSIPEFEMLIKLSEILNVSLYELSICHRIENESLTRKTINKFKSIKDFKKYKFRKKLKIILLIIFFILFTITAAYTIKHNDTVEIYKLESTDDNYYFEGYYIHVNSSNSLYMKDFYNKNYGKDKNLIISNDCEYKIFDDNKRILYIINNNDKQTNSYNIMPYYQLKYNIKINSTLNMSMRCIDNNKEDNHFFSIKITNIYNNKLF